MQVNYNELKSRTKQWKSIRVAIWAAIYQDNCALLEAALRDASDKLCLSIDEVLFQLQRKLWGSNKGKRSKNKSSGEVEYNDRGLLEECAGNLSAGRANAPEYGASNCIEWLAEHFPQAWKHNEIKWALRRAKRLNRRAAIHALLKHFPEYMEIKDMNNCEILEFKEQDSHSID